VSSVTAAIQLNMDDKNRLKNQVSSATATIRLNMAYKQLTQESGESRYSVAIQLNMADKQLTQGSDEQRHCNHSS
jgi:hypothetical protein